MNPRPPPVADARPSEPDVLNLRAAYTALDHGDPAPMVGLLDQRVHLRGPEHGHLWWTSVDTWNGVDQVRQALEDRRAEAAHPPTGDPVDPAGTGRTSVRAGTVIRHGDCLIVTHHQASATGATERRPDNRAADVCFYEVVTMRGGRIVRLRDYRNRNDALAAATERR